MKQRSKNESLLRIVEHGDPEKATKKKGGKAKPMRPAPPNPRLKAKCKVCGRAMPEGRQTCCDRCCLRLAEYRLLGFKAEMRKGMR